MKREHERFMRRALTIARRANNVAAPNPTVGAVLVKGGRVIASGHTERFGGRHAERVVLEQAGKRAAGATLYSTLAPCDHTGKTPPCTDAIIAANIRRAVIGVDDPTRNGVQKLRHAGIHVDCGVLQQEAARLYEHFLFSAKNKRPFVLVKVATSLDGKITWRKDASPRRFSSLEGLQWVHELRSRFEAICVGIRSVEIDNPRLTARVAEGRNPHRIVVDATCRLSPRARIFEAPSGRVFVLTTRRAPNARRRALERAGATVLLARTTSIGTVNITDALRRLYRDHGITSILVEGGGELIASLVRARLVDKFCLLMSPILVGGRDTPTAMDGLALKKFSEIVRVKSVTMQRVGDDMLIEGYVDNEDRSGSASAPSDIQKRV